MLVAEEVEEVPVAILLAVGVGGLGGELALEAEKVEGIDIAFQAALAEGSR